MVPERCGPSQVPFWRKVSVLPSALGTGNPVRGRLKVPRSCSIPSEHDTPHLGWGPSIRAPPLPSSVAAATPLSWNRPTTPS